MSNALALASVSAVIMDLLNDGLANANLNAMAPVTVTAQPPDTLSGDSVTDINRLNLYLWNVTRNTGWANERLPARSSDGARLDLSLIHI